MLYLQHPTMQLDLPYPLVVTKSLLLKPFCHLEIVDLPIKHAGSFHSFLGLFARGSVGSFDIEKIHLNGDSGWISGWITWLVGGG